MNKKLKDNTRKVIFSCFVVYSLQGLSTIMLTPGVLDYDEVYKKKFPILEEIDHIRYVSNNYQALLSEESKEKLKFKEESLMNKLSDIEKELVPLKVKRDKAIRRAVNPLTYLTESS